MHEASPEPGVSEWEMSVVLLVSDDAWCRGLLSHPSSQRIEEVRQIIATVLLSFVRTDSAACVLFSRACCCCILHEIEILILFSGRSDMFT
ncbi:hypothetical protein CBR_g50367 [Chara braunii]|uniref:Uncharacterized protein n=1 Tax=Chara braunii TaxID=69332 RepID=A0A388K5K8_CHABU|nr:hypothetical protein CBR_g50367 [Chara braunii]|eukprot:GBG65331.1 hypothetical protein CBR_g50367 [Chara braunii]